MTDADSRESEENQEPIFQKAGMNWSVVVRADEMKVKAFLDVDSLGNSTEAPKVEEIQKALRSSGLKLVESFDTLVADAFAPFTGEMAQPLELRDLLVAEGKVPEKGAAAEIKWFVEWERKKEVSMVEDQADYRDTGHIVQVKEGDPILQVTPATQGPEGVDVFGEAIPGLFGDPVPYQFGKNVELDASSNILHALIPGEVRRDDEQLWVDSVYSVEGDVDFNVGNIDFAGDVRIGGSVQDGFVVKAKGDIKVFGSVLAATLEAGENLYIGEGATGHGKGSLSANGLIQAKYLNGVTVTAGGDLKVTNEVINCKTKVGGRATIERGSVVGGEFVARLGLETRSIGTQIAVPTVVRVGIDPQTDLRRQAILTRMKEINRQIERIYLNIKPFVEDPAKVAKLPKQRKELVKQFLLEMAGLKAERDSHEKDLKELEIEEVAPDDLYVRVSKAIFGKTTIHIGRCSQAYPVEAYGPLTLIPDDVTGRLKNK